jgi:hypothetical protein
MRALVDPSTKELRKRNDVWREIISTEESYVHSLRLLEEVCTMLLLLLQSTLVIPTTGSLSLSLCVCVCVLFDR